MEPGLWTGFATKETPSGGRVPPFMKRRTTIAFPLSVPPFSGSTMETPLEVDVTTAARLLDEGALMLDVREAFEVATCAVAGSRHVPMRQIPETLSDLPRDRLILVLCHVGGRSLRVTQFLRANG